MLEAILPFVEYRGMYIHRFGLRFACLSRTGMGSLWRPDALELAAADVFEAFERKCEMRAALGRSHGMDFVENDGLYRLQGSAGSGGQQ